MIRVRKVRVRIGVGCIRRLRGVRSWWNNWGVRERLRCVRKVLGGVSSCLRVERKVKG